MFKSPKTFRPKAIFFVCLDISSIILFFNEYGGMQHAESPE